MPRTTHNNDAQQRQCARSRMTQWRQWHTMMMHDITQWWRGVACQWDTRRQWQWPRRCICIVWAIGKFFFLFFHTFVNLLPQISSTMTTCHIKTHNDHTRQRQRHASSTTTTTCYVNDEAWQRQQGGRKAKWGAWDTTWHVSNLRYVIIIIIMIYTKISFDIYLGIRGPVLWTGKKLEPNQTEPRSGFFSGSVALKTYNGSVAVA